MREGSLTKTWHPTTFDALVTGLRDSAGVCLDFVASLGMPPVDEAAVRYAIYLRWVSWLRSGEAKLVRRARLREPAWLVSAFGEIAEYPDVAASQPEIVRAWLRDSEKRLARATRRAERALGDQATG